MKRWHLIAIALLAGAVAYWMWGRSEAVSSHVTAWLAHVPGRARAEAAAAAVRPSSLTWQTMERPDEGFRIDLPGDPRDVEVPAYNDAGGTESVKMMVASPDGDTTFAVTWEDNPPVARVNNRLPERTLEMAGDGMLARTRTTLSSDSRVTFKGNPAREITARNASGGVLHARLIFAGERLYTLLALFPSDRARHDAEVKHFFNSFEPAGQSPIPETVPSATAPGN